MAERVYRTTTFSTQQLVESINQGHIALPDLQRPFVWKPSKVRDLLDSMYRGFPVGYLLLWATDAEPGARQIGTAHRDQSAPRWLIVDGQQRLTSLYSVMTGNQVLRDDYSQSRIRIAFRPKDGTFAVANAQTDNNVEYVADVTQLWQSFRKTSRAFIERYETARGELTDDELEHLEDNLDRVRDLQTFQFDIVELDASVDEEQVAEIFVRINSEGVKLNQADFILTLMSVFWDEGRTQLEDFSRKAKIPSVSGPSPFNWYLQPSPDQLLRVVIAAAFDRAALKHAYSILRGKELATGKVTAQRREEQFALLQRAQQEVLNLTNWHSFLDSIERAGYRSGKVISSENTVVFTYAIWLIGRIRYQVKLDDLREVIARWFFMSQLTSRYTGSFESQAEQDFAIILERAATDGFTATLDRIISNTLTHDFWTIRLPNMLDSSAARSPSLFSYYAALNILDADVLLSTVKVRDRFDPALTAKKGVERHHLFPKAYLKSELDISDQRLANQIANFALVDWHDNISISDAAPSEYWQAQIEAKPYLSGERLKRQLHWHALPEGWTDLPYSQFVEQRRPLMAEVVREAFEQLRSPEYAPEYPAAPAAPTTPATQGSSGIDLEDLLEAKFIVPGTVLVAQRETVDSTGVINESGQIVIEEVAYISPSAAARAAAGTTSENGWTFWRVGDERDAPTLDELRAQYLRQNATPVATD